MAALLFHLGSKNTSSWSLRPWLAARRAGLSFTENVIPFRQPDTAARLRAVSPTGKVPVLIDGEMIIPDSLAICEYIAELVPEAGLWPSDRQARALARAAAAEMHSSFAALRQTMPMDIVGRYPGMGQTPETLADIARIEALWAAARARFAEAGPFLFGRFSIADAMFAPVCTRFVTYAPPITPVSAAYVETVINLPEMRDWEAAAQAGT